MNIYKKVFTARCPADGEDIVYELEITSPIMIRVEAINVALKATTVGFQENIADDLSATFPGIISLKGTHQGVAIESVRGTYDLSEG